MNHCHDCNSDYQTPGTCNCFAPGGKRWVAPCQPYVPMVPLIPVPTMPVYPWMTTPVPWWMTPITVTLGDQPPIATGSFGECTNANTATACFPATVKALPQPAAGAYT